MRADACGWMEGGREEGRKGSSVCYQHASTQNQSLDVLSHTCRLLSAVSQRVFINKPHSSMRPMFAGYTTVFDEKMAFLSAGPDYLDPNKYLPVVLVSGLCWWDVVQHPSTGSQQVLACSCVRLSGVLVVVCTARSLSSSPSMIVAELLIWCVMCTAGGDVHHHGTQSVGQAAQLLHQVALPLLHG